MVIRADAEDDIRGAVAFAAEHALKLIIAGGLEAWRCADVLKERDVPVLMNVERLPARESDRYDAAYANAAKLRAAGVRFAIVSDDASQSRNLPYEAAMSGAAGRRTCGSPRSGRSGHTGTRTTARRLTSVQILTASQSTALITRMTMATIRKM